MPEPTEILDMSFEVASQDLDSPLVEDEEIQERIEYVCRCQANRAGVRVLLAGALAKTHDRSLDIRKPYTAIEGTDAYSGRQYDERHITPFINRYDLPCNATTAFLTPALRNRDQTLTPETHMVGRPPDLYRHLLQLLADIQSGSVGAEDVLRETVRCLLVMKSERQTQLQALLASLKSRDNTFVLSSEGVVRLIEQHLDCPYSSRLPVLVVVAAYKAAQARLGERVLPLTSHTAADSQTGALGDLEITLLDDDEVMTSYEMKNRPVTRSDIDVALQKIGEAGLPIDNYILITTETIDRDVL